MAIQLTEKELRHLGFEVSPEHGQAIRIGTAPRGPTAQDTRLIAEVVVPDWRREMAEREDQARSTVGVQRLAASIERYGLLNPVTIMPDNTLVAGLRRLEACKLLGWTRIPVFIGGFRDG